MNPLPDMPGRAHDAEDPLTWLEDVFGEEPLAWVSRQNARSREVLGRHPEFDVIAAELLDTYEDGGRIPMVTARGGLYYNFWRDEAHRRGLWRRTTASSYRSDEPEWETLLDVDALSRAENESWVFAGAEVLYPDLDRVLITLSRGGSDAHVIREFDLPSRQFVADGFALPQAKGRMTWIDRDHVYVASDFGPDTMTASGYPRQIRKWQRGTALAAAAVVFEGTETDVGVQVIRSHYRRDGKLVWHEFFHRSVRFYSTTVYLARGETRTVLPVPDDAEVQTFRNQLLIALRSDWTMSAAQGQKTWPRGATLAIDLDHLLAGSCEFVMLYTPGVRKSLAGLTVLEHAVLISESVELQARAIYWRLVDGQWSCAELPVPGGINGVFLAVDPDASDDCFLLQSSPVQPATLSLVSGSSLAVSILKAAPAQFDATGMSTIEYSVPSADGTAIPYLVVTPAGFVADGSAPTLLHAYGGFEVPLLPADYDAPVGRVWLRRGGVLVIAGIRGGGEFGPAWHQAALREQKQKSYDDLIAVAQDLLDRQITTPRHLAIRGRSNGGLLVGAVMVQRPELFRAVVCEVPLLDMRRFHRLLAGASWIAEYGDPDDPEQWRYIARYSPYQNLREGTTYPHVLLLSSTRDDRVHPGHARKMAARMQALGADVLYYENTEGGHAGAADHAQAADLGALAYTFLLGELR